MDPPRLPRRARVVIIGAGVVGSSAAYYLTRYGWDDVVVLDQGPLFQVLGSTSHAPGLVFQTNPSRTVCKLAQWTVRLYRELDSQAEGPCFHPVGSIEVAGSPERHRDLKRRIGLARSWGLPARILTPEEVGSLIPQIDTRRIYSGYHVPSDGLGKGVRILKALAREAGSRGALFVSDARVTAIESRQGRVTAVVCNRGRIETETVLLCAGIWGPRVGEMAGVPVPMQPMQHLYARTGPLSVLAGASDEVTQPVLRHQDRSMYSRQDFDCYGVGSYRHEPLPIDIESLAPDPSGAPQAALRPFPSQHFENALDDSKELFRACAGHRSPSNSTASSPSLQTDNLCWEDPLIWRVSGLRRESGSHTAAAWAGPSPSTWLKVCPRWTCGIWTAIASTPMSPAGPMSWLEDERNTGKSTTSFIPTSR